MKTTNYSEQIKSPLWQKKRLEILQRDNWECKLCQDTETTLHVHHDIYIKGNKAWEYDSNTLYTVCEHCHSFIELIKKWGDVIFNIKDIKAFKINFTKEIYFLFFHIKDNDYFIKICINGKINTFTVRNEIALKLYDFFTSTINKLQ